MTKPTIQSGKTYYDGKGNSHFIEENTGSFSKDYPFKSVSTYFGSEYFTAYGTYYTDGTPAELDLVVPPAIAQQEINPAYAYYTFAGDPVTFKAYNDTTDDFYSFDGSNLYYYSSNGKIFENESDYFDNQLNDIDFTKTPILTSALNAFNNTKEPSMQNTQSIFIEDFTVSVTNTIKRKSKVNGVKRKIKIDRLNNDTFQVTIKTAYPELNGPLVTRFALSYDALDLFEEAVEAMYEELQDEEWLL